MVANETTYPTQHERDSREPDTGESHFSTTQHDGNYAPGNPTPTAYGLVSAVYDALMAAVPHDAWLRRIETECARRAKTPRSVLDVACGTGIVSELLVHHGYYPVVGIDLSAPMIRIARTKADAHNLAEKITYHVQDAATMDLDAARFDLAVSLFDSLNYIIDPNDLSKAFVRIAHHLNPGAVLAFDVNSLYALSHDLFTQTGASGPLSHVWKSHWDRESRTCRVEMDFTLTGEKTGEPRQFHETHVQRAYTITELREMLEAAGFVNISVYGNYGERTPGPKSDRLFFACEMRG
ncbi:MAG: class I SAM-dependent methyltransferase [Akkermansiaceae bacterium]|nr:class I SAM-dependent methyltransferase [Armatimonadota bacterium]